MNSREERQSALPDAFTPPSDMPPDDFDPESEAEGDEMLFTTPFALLAVRTPSMVTTFSSLPQS